MAIVVLAIGYALARARFTHEYSAVPWSRLLALAAPLPFGHRVLIPWLARPVVEAGVSPTVTFAVVEGVCFFVIVYATARALEHFVSPARARLSATLVGVVMPLVYVVPRRWPLLYPWDGPALAVLALALWATVRRRYAWVAALAAVGALNRETAVLIPALVLAIHIGQPSERPRAWAWAQLSLAVVVLVRIGVALALPNNPGPPLHFTIGGGAYRVLSNLQWLADGRNLLLWISYVGVVPLAWPVLLRRVPKPLHRVGLVGLGYIVAAQVVANIYEPRAWGEAVYLATLPAVVALCGSRVPSDPTLPRWLRWVDRYTVVVLLVGFVAFVAALMQWRFLPVAQWPMPK